jgi:hypothetical protein
MKNSLASDSDTPGSPATQLLFKRLLASTGPCLALLLAGCGSSTEVGGTYHRVGGGGVSFTLESGKVSSTVRGESYHGTYEVQGEQVIVHLPGQRDVPLKINDDGTLDVPVLGTFKKD